MSIFCYVIEAEVNNSKMSYCSQSAHTLSLLNEPFHLKNPGERLCYSSVYRKFAFRQEIKKVKGVTMIKTIKQCLPLSAPPLMSTCSFDFCHHIMKFH